MKWRPLLYRSPSRQLRQATAMAQYSNLECVSRLRATLYKKRSLESIEMPVLYIGSAVPKG